ncbi:hypothetical protein HWV62_14786 [Athelia sp. TMB]|nr:hypothetical protein HWV62_14786 [Athelia sp. TMB]
MSDQQSSGGVSDKNDSCGSSGNGPDFYGQGQGQQQSGGQGGYDGQPQIQGQGLDEQQFCGGVSGGEQDVEVRALLIDDRGRADGSQSASLESEAQAFVRKFGLTVGSDL